MLRYVVEDDLVSAWKVVSLSFRLFTFSTGLEFALLFYAVEPTILSCVIRLHFSDTQKIKILNFYLICDLCLEFVT